MFEVGKIKIEKGLLLAPMEDISGIGFRRLCKEMGADVVYTEFVNSDGLIRANKKTHQKLKIREEERPVGIQIYGHNIDSMVGAAKIAEQENPDFIDINAGCWVKKVANRGAGAGLLKDPPYLQKMVEEIVKVVDIPVTVKTRIGWDADSIYILDIAKRIEDAGVKALTVHCRTRQQGHSGEPDWDWVNKIKEVVDIPVALNGGVMTPEDALQAFKDTTADAVMIARGAIGNPWIFREAKELITTGKISKEIDAEDRIQTTLKHLKYETIYKEEKFAVITFRKFYSGYLKGLYNAAKVRASLMAFEEYIQVEEVLLEYLDFLKKRGDEKEILDQDQIESK